ncbi:MAG: hypothetical protein DHS20C17_09450 [Cyclobacteriaceae bacterium]|nr:MAG: hypothetical protein DHS20C17_09450 [Cyclobacteriaceae bacterium]
MSAEIQLLYPYLSELVYRQLEGDAQQWLQKKLSQLQAQPKPRDLYLTFSAMPRFIGKAPLTLSREEIYKVQGIRAGLSLEGWTLPQAARVLTVCSYRYPDADTFLKLMDQLFSAAEVSELVALYSSLPVLPYPEKLKLRASEGIRTNMSVVFDAVVLNNPYPVENLDESAWNQMVLKALFMERPLYKIYGLEQRSNLELSKMISNYAHERWAANRTTSPEMWRPIGDQGTVSIYQDLERLITMDQDQQAAAILTAIALNTREAQSFLDRNQQLVEQTDRNKTTWDELGKRWWSKQNPTNKN